MKAIAYVASTLPIGFLDKHIEDFKIEAIILHRAQLESYKYLVQLHPSVSLKVLPKFWLFYTICLMLIFIRIRIFNYKIYFFHECCCPIFDVLIKIIRPAGHFYPQVSLQSFINIPSHAMPKSKIQIMLRLIRLTDYFTYYQAEDDNGCLFYSMAVKEYPDRIKRHKISENKLSLTSNHSKDKVNFTKNRILLLIGRDVQGDQRLKKLYSLVVALAFKYSFNCDIKDHPNETSRLGFVHNSARVIEPNLPVELIEDRYALVLGTCSTGLLSFADKAISLMKIEPNVSEDILFRRISHLTSIPHGQLIKFPETIAKLEEIFVTEKNKFDIRFSDA